MRPGTVVSGGLLAFAGLCWACITTHADLLTASAPVVAAAAPAAAVAPPPPAPPPVAVDTAATRVATSIAERLTGRTIEFQTGSAVITPRGRAVLDSLIPLLQSAPTARFEVAGHTDSRGVPARNQALSDARARSVVRYLGGHGIAPARLASRGYGATRPLTTDTTAAALQRNRRIEFTPLPEP